MTRRGLLLATGLVLGCGAGKQSGTVVELWAMGREGEVVKGLLSAFEQENPAVKVRVQQIPWTAAHEKLLTAYVGHATPDVAQLGNTWIAEFVALGALEDLTGRCAVSGVVRQEHHFPGAWDSNVLNGKVWGVPWYVDTRVLFYRQDLLRAAGWSTPPPHLE